MDWHGKVAQLKEERDEVTAQRDALLAALEAVEWVFNAFGDNICWWCRAEKFSGHADDCQREAAIAKAKGEKR